MPKWKETLQKQMSGTIFRPYHLCQEAKDNFAHVMGCMREGRMREGRMRDEGFTYNPEHPYMQRVPCVHGRPLDDSLLQVAVMACFQYHLEHASRSYPSGKGH